MAYVMHNSTQFWTKMKLLLQGNT